MSKQPSFGKFLPVALMIGLAAAIVVYLSAAFAPAYPWAGAVWLVFIGWALYFMAGAKVSRIHKYALGLVGGVLFGWLTLYLVGFVTDLVGASFGLPLTVFGVATVIVLLELTNAFELAPAYFFSFASYFAYVFGGFGGTATQLEQAMHVSIMLLVGVGVGFVTASLRKMIMDLERVPFETRGTIFDKEN